MNHNGRIEKSVTAHQGACLTAQWSPDGAGLLTGDVIFFKLSKCEPKHNKIIISDILPSATTIVQ